MQKKLQKIYIIGPAGSGKTTLANKLGKKYNLPILNLDDIFWKTRYTQENSPKQKQTLLQEFLNHNKKIGWIIDGANKDFIPTIAPQATEIIWLNPNIFILIYRITKRFLTSKYLDVRRLSKNKSKTKKETWSGFYRLSKGVITYKLHNDLYHLHKKTAKLHSISHPSQSTAYPNHLKHLS